MKAFFWDSHKEGFFWDSHNEAFFWDSYNEGIFWDSHNEGFFFNRIVILWYQYETFNIISSSQSASSLYVAEKQIDEFRLTF